MPEKDPNKILRDLVLSSCALFLAACLSFALGARAYITNNQGDLFAVGMLICVLCFGLIAWNARRAKRAADNAKYRQAGDIKQPAERRGLVAKCAHCKCTYPSKKLSERGYCPQCEQAYQKALAEHIEKKKQSAPKKKTAGKPNGAPPRSSVNDFDALLRRIPSMEIALSHDAPDRKRKFFDADALGYVQIEPQSSPDALGSFVVLDVETTGLKWRDSRIVEVAAMRFENFEPTEVFTTLIDPEIDIPETASSVNHITNSMVVGAPKIGEIMDALQKFIGDAPIVGHNLPFDLKFICSDGLKVGEQPLYDTLAIARANLSTPESEGDAFDAPADYHVTDHKLDTLCGYFGIVRSHASAHRAVSDCLATGLVFRGLVQQITK